VCFCVPLYFLEVFTIQVKFSKILLGSAVVALTGSLICLIETTPFKFYQKLVRNAIFGALSPMNDLELYRAGYPGKKEAPSTINLEFYQNKRECVPDRLLGRYC